MCDSWIVSCYVACRMESWNVLPIADRLIALSAVCTAGPLSAGGPNIPCYTRGPLFVNPIGQSIDSVCRLRESQGQCGPPAESGPDVRTAAGRYTRVWQSAEHSMMPTDARHSSSRSNSRRLYATSGVVSVLLGAIEVLSSQKSK